VPPSCALPVVRAARDGGSGDAYTDCVRDCILLGGCSSSRAAIAGGLVAAARGVDAIPVEWILKVFNIQVVLDDLLAVLEAPAV